MVPLGGTQKLNKRQFMQVKCHSAHSYAPQHDNELDKTHMGILINLPNCAVLVGMCALHV